MDDEDYGILKRWLISSVPRKPLYVSTIKKSNIVKGKAKMVIILIHINFLHIFFTTYENWHYIY
jgi:hypothetical protein